MERLEDSLNPTERVVADLTLAGMSGQDIARQLGRDPARVSQIRRGIAEKWAG